MINVCTLCGCRFTAVRSRVKRCEDCKTHQAPKGATHQGPRGRVFCRHCGARVSTGAADVCFECLTKQATVNERERLVAVEHAVPAMRWATVEQIQARLAERGQNVERIRLVSDLRALAWRVGPVRQGFSASQQAIFTRMPRGVG